MLEIFLSIYLLFTYAITAYVYVMAAGLAGVGVMMIVRAWKIFREGQVFWGLFSLLIAFPPFVFSFIIIAKLQKGR